MTHTPAPWTLNPAQSTRVDLIDNPKGEAIGEVVWVDVRNPADARLIVAAPDLLAALDALHLAVTMRPTGQGGLSMAERMALDQARAILAKARGTA
jgi:hypothetical protein